MRTNLSPNGVLSVDFFDGFIFRFIQEIYFRGDKDCSALGRYYVSRLTDRVGGIQDYENALFQHMTRTFPKLRCIIHVGIGIGTITSLLAATGRRVIGIESDTQRFRIAAQLRLATVTVWPNVSSQYHLVEGVYPQALENLLESQGTDCLLLLTNFVVTQTQEVQDAIIATFCRFGNVVLDLRTFCDLRELEKQRSELRDRILAAGMNDAGPIPTAPGNYYYRFTQKRPQ
jgi:hypothetical protein